MLTFMTTFIKILERRRVDNVAENLFLRCASSENFSKVNERSIQSSLRCQSFAGTMTASEMNRAFFVFQER